MKDYIIENVKRQIRQHPFILRWVVYILTEFQRGSIRRFIHWLFAGHIVKSLRIQKWLQGTQPKYLQVGGGCHLKTDDGWLNGDIIDGEIYLDAGHRLPFPDESIDVVFTEQFIEHLSQQDALCFLNEAYRVLKVGGIIRQSTPDLGKLVTIYEDRNELVSLSAVISRHMRNHRNVDVTAEATACQFINDMFRLWGHQFIYDKEALKSAVEQAGFGEFCWVSFGGSNHCFLINLERHADEEWMKNGFVMVCEASK